jgi:hypothetical protein
LAAAAGVVLVWSAQEPTAQGGDILGSIGAFFGKPFGGLINAATAPTIANVQGAVNQVVANVDDRLNKDVVRAGDVLKNDANQVVTQGLTQVDTIAAARIDQVYLDTSKIVGQVGALENKAIVDVKSVVKDVDTRVNKDLDRIDSIVDTRIQQVDGVVKDAIGQADTDIKARIAQADDAAQKALGSADVLVAKETLGIQAALIRVGGVIGAVIFLVASLWWLFQHLPAHLQETARITNSEDRWKRHRRFAWVSAASVSVHVVFGAACFAGLMWLSNNLPASAQRSTQALITSHETALGESAAGLDFTMVRYHAAELAILNPDGVSKYRALEHRAGLVRAALTRPGLLASQDGIGELAAMIDGVRMLGDAQADVYAVMGYVEWQLARNRADEAKAVGAFVHAFDVDKQRKDPNDPTTAFVLRGFASRYVALFCQRRPASFAWPNGMAPSHSLDEVCSYGAAATAPPLLRPLSTYDDAVLDLVKKSDAAYVKMLDAQASLEAATSVLGKEPVPTLAKGSDGLSPAQKSVYDAKRARLDAATALQVAWVAFDHAVDGDSTLPSAARAALFTLNDVPLTQAVWAINSPDDTKRPPAIAKVADKVLRMRSSPARVTWAGRYLGGAGPLTQVVAAREVTSAYTSDERRTIDFEDAYIDYRKALAARGVDLTSKRDAAAAAASTMGIYDDATPRRPLASSLPDGVNAAPASVNDDGVRLRLL